MNISQNDATRIVKAIDYRIQRTIGRGSIVETTYGSVDEIDGAFATVLIGGDENASGGFRIPVWLHVQVGDRVRVLIDPRGYRRIEEVVSVDHPLIKVDHTRGKLLLGTGSAAPTTGTEGQVPTVQSDGTLAYETPSVGGGGGGLGDVSVVKYTESDTWTKTAGLHHVVVEVVGGGGGGGGATSTSGSQNSAGSGGGAGAYARKVFMADDLPSSVTVTVGGGGTSGDGSGGSNGGQSSFLSSGEASGAGLSQVVAGGGFGGDVISATSTTAIMNGGPGGTASGGDVNVAGSPGTAAAVISALRLPTGNGGSNPLGAGGPAGDAADAGAGGGYGGGGGGSTTTTSSGPRPGGAGADGVVIVTEFYDS